MPPTMTMAAPVQIVLPCGAQWRTLNDAGHELTYWQQSDEGRWEKKD